MMCFIHYISAVRRLTEVEKTVTMLKSDKYSERDVPEMVLAQRDFIKKERDYFRDRCIEWGFGIFVCLMLYLFYWIFVNRIANRV